MKRESIMVLCSMLIIFILPLSSASITFHNESLKKNYIGGEQISGEIAISLKNEPSESVLKSNFPGNITLFELLKANNLEQGIDYTCSSNRCVSVYKPLDGDAKDIDMGAGEKTIGFVIEKDSDVEIKKADFLISSELGVSCQKQMEISILGKNDSLIYNPNYIPDSSMCSTKLLGCFSSSLSDGKYRNATLSSEPYCNKITLETAPAYEFGGSISASSNSTKIVLELFDSDLNYLSFCNPNVKTGLSEVKCIINQSIPKKGDYYICISTASETSDYKIKFENDGNVCGGVGAGDTSQRDYDLFAKSLPYAPITNMSISKALMDNYQLNLAEEADRYIEEVYNRNCSSSCYIPFTITGGISQNIKISNLSFEYSSKKTTISEAPFKILDKTSALISSIGQLNLKIDPAKFLIPVSSKEKKLEMRLGSVSLLNPPRIIGITPGFEFDVVPRFALIGIETNFMAVTSQNITLSTWKFGENTLKKSNGKSISYSYVQAGNYTLDVSLTNNAGTTLTKQFNILVGNANESARKMINDSNMRFQEISKQINILDPLTKNFIENRLNMSSIKSKIEDANLKYNSAKNESDYIEVINNLMSLNLPHGIKVSKAANLPLSIGFSSIDLSYIESISNQSVSDSSREELKLNLLDWNEKNHKADINFKIVSSYNADGEISPITSSFRINLNLKSEEPAYIIIDYPLEEMYFPDNSGAKPISSESGSGTYLQVNGRESIEFIIKGNVNPESLGMYISPKISVLGDYKEKEPVPVKEVPKGLLIFWIIALVISMFIIYIILQEWYKRHYESHLFKNPDDLYNTIHFIYNSRVAGLKDEDIKKKLESSGWSGEQVSYAFKKIDGKRTGMFEIPVFSIFEHNKVREEIAKREDKPVDARFIKRY